MISGCNMVASRFRPQESYTFIKYGHIWGWASWRRAWKNFDVEMKQWPSWRDAGGLHGVSPNDRPFEAHWRKVFDSAYTGTGMISDAWDYLWQFACWRSSQLAVQPTVSLIENIGFRPDATHTTSEVPEFLRASSPQEMSFPLQHPSSVTWLPSVDSVISKVVFRISYRRYFLGCLRQIPLLGALAGRIVSTLKAIPR
jgi:hypothetical protein